MVTKTFLKPTYLLTYLCDSSARSDSSDSSDSSDRSDSSNSNDSSDSSDLWQLGVLLAYQLPILVISHPPARHHLACTLDSVICGQQLILNKHGVSLDDFWHERTENCEKRRRTNIHIL